MLLHDIEIILPPQYRPQVVPASRVLVTLILSKRTHLADFPLAIADLLKRIVFCNNTVLNLEQDPTAKLYHIAAVKLHTGKIEISVVFLLENNLPFSLKFFHVVFQFIYQNEILTGRLIKRFFKSVSGRFEPQPSRENLECYP